MEGIYFSCGFSENPRCLIFTEELRREITESNLLKSVCFENAIALVNRRISTTKGGRVLTPWIRVFALYLHGGCFVQDGDFYVETGQILRKY